MKPQLEKTGRPWTDSEIELAVASYFRMLLYQRIGYEFSKTEMRRALKEQLRVRSDKAIDFKWCNVSAVLAEMGLPWIEGFKPLPHLQQSLRLAVHRWFDPKTILGRTPSVGDP